MIKIKLLKAPLTYQSLLLEKSHWIHKSKMLIKNDSEQEKWCVGPQRTPSIHAWKTKKIFIYCIHKNHISRPRFLCYTAYILWTPPICTIRYIHTYAYVQIYSAPYKLSCLTKPRVWKSSYTSTKTQPQAVVLQVAGHGPKALRYADCQPNIERHADSLIKRGRTRARPSVGMAVGEGETCLYHVTRFLFTA